MARLGDYVRIRTGKLDANASSENGQYPFFTCAVEPLRIDSFSYDCECVLVAGNGDLNVKYYNGKFDAYQRTYIIESLDKSILSVPYLYCFLEEYVETLRLQSIGGVIKYIKLGNLTEAPIPLPSLDEQERIVEQCEHAKKLLSLRKQQLAKLDELVKSRFIELFGDVIHNSKAWQMRLFADIASSRLGKMLDAKQQTGKCSYPYLANFNVQWFRFNIENLNQMDFDEDDRAEFELKDGDLLVCEGGEIGRCAVWHNEIQPCFFQKALHRVRCNRQIIQPDYLAWWFKYKCDYDGFAAIAGAKATIAHLPGVKLKQLQVAVPPIELQQQFAAFVEQTDKSKLVVQQSIDQLETLKKSLMQKYFG